MLALKIVGCIVLFLAFILSLRAKITVEYTDEVRLYVRVLCFKVKILPKKQKKKGPFSMSEKKAKKIKERLRKKALKKKLKKQKKQEQKQQEQKTGKKKKKSLSEILDMVSMVKDIVTVVIKKFFGHLRIDLARVKIKVATGDAATTAIAYGAICDAALHLFHILEPVKGFDLPSARDIDIQADYLSESSSVDIKISFALRVWHVLHVALAALGKLIGHMVKNKAKNK